MAPDDTVERLARLALFSDLSNPELEGVAHGFEEELFPEGQRILRQGLSGSGLYVILDGEAAVIIDGTERARLGRGEFFGEVSALVGEPPTADVVAATSLRCLVVPGPEVRSFLLSHPQVAYRMLQSEAEARDDPSVARVNNRPYPPGDYPVVVVGSGPGGLQTSYSLARLGIEHAVISSDEAPGGMFQRWPIFQRLLSWTKPDAPFPPESEEFEWYDHNSLLADEPEHRALVAAEMDRSWMVPSRPEMERGLAAFAERAGVRVRYGCGWESTRREEDGFVLATTDGEYRCQAAVFAIGVTEPWRSPIPGIDQAAHYIDCRSAPSYRGKDVVVLGKRNSGFEIADALVPWARRVTLCSPRPVQSAVLALSTIRVRYYQPYEDASWGGGTFVLNAAIESIERKGGGFRVHAKGTTRPDDFVLDADEVIAATGFATPLRDLTDLGVATVAQGRIPALTPFWESATVPGIYFAGNATQGAAGLRKHGVGSASGTVSGFRYNARLLARHLAETRFGVASERPALRQEEVVPYVLRELRSGPALWNQKAYLTRVVSLGTDDAPRDEGVVPLAHFLDSTGPDSVAGTVEMDGDGRIYPVVYLRRRGREIEELIMEPHPLHVFDGEDYRRALEDRLAH